MQLTLENSSDKLSGHITLFFIRCLMVIFFDLNVFLKHFNSLCTLPPPQALLRYVSSSKTPPCRILKNGRQPAKLRSLGRPGSTSERLWRRQLCTGVDLCSILRFRGVVYGFDLPSPYNFPAFSLSLLPWSFVSPFKRCSWWRPLCRRSLQIAAGGCGGTAP